MPASPPVVFVPPSAGAPPASAGAIYEPAPAGKQVLNISGVSTGGANGPVIYAGLNDGKAAWSTDGTLVSGASNTIVKSDSGVWSVARGSSYSATKTSAAATPDGLTAWTVGTGTGSPSLAAATVSAGAVVFTPPAAPTPAVAGAVFTPPSPFTPNFLETAFAGADNDLRFSQVDGGSPPTMRFLMVTSGGSSVTVTGRAIVVRLMQNFSNYYLLASDVKAFIETSVPAMALISVSYKAGNDGSGQVCQPTTTDISFGPTALAGGVYLAAPPAVFAP